LKKANSFLFRGIGLGLVGPVLLFGLYFIWKGGDFSFIDFISQQYRLRLLSPVISLCALINLGLFWWFIQREQSAPARGIIIATLFWALLMVILKFLL
jgi:hypothetical protein